MTMFATNHDKARIAAPSPREKAGDSGNSPSGCAYPCVIMLGSGEIDSWQSRVCVIWFDENTILLAGFGKMALPSVLLLFAAFVSRHRWAGQPLVLLACRLGATGLLVAFASGVAQAGNSFPGTTITGTSGSLTASNVGTAPGEAGEPTTFGGGNLDTMWYSWTAPSAGTLTVETCSTTQTNFDTTLAAFTGTAVNALSAIVNNDDACAGTSGTLASRVSLVVASGTTYRFQVDGFGNATGNFRLGWNLVAGSGAPVNDNFQGTTITGPSGSITGTNIGATSQAGESTPPGGALLETVWYNWTATANGTLTVGTCSNTQTNFDTTMAVYTGAAVGALGTPVASNDDACATTYNVTHASQVSFAVTAGTTYRIQIDGYGGPATGNFLLTWSFSGPQFALTKTASVSSISAPGTITYTIRVENTGNTTLTGLTISDTLLLGGSARTLTSGPTYTSGDTNSNGQINTTETWFYTATYAVTQADIDAGGTFSNTATYDTGQTVPSTSAPATTSITQSPSLSINKSAGLLTDLNSDGQAGAGDVVRYTYAVSNTGNVTVANVTVAETSFNGSNGTPSPGSETLTGDVAPLGDSTDAAGPGIWGSLRPGDTVSFTADYTVNQQDVDQLQ